MPSRRFKQVDVFSSTACKGNPVAVVLDEFANWTHLSETTFITPPTHSSAHYRLAIYTPARKLPFAGHPTLGSAHAWAQSTGFKGDELIQECEAGLITLKRIDGKWHFKAPPMIKDGPLDEATFERQLQLLNLNREDVIASSWTDNGPGWSTFQLKDAVSVLAVKAPSGYAGIWPALVGLHPDGTPELRGFASSVGEDPVTGSLNSACAQWLIKRGVIKAPYTARQGTVLGREGRISIVQDENGAVWTGGATQTIIDGSVTL